MIDPHIVCLGEPGAGKSTAAALLGELGWRTISFAGRHPGGLRDVVERTLGATAATQRDILNKVGMGCRAIYEDFWVIPWERQFALYAEGGPIANDDLRFQNEYDRLRELGFVFIRIEAPRTLRIRRLQASGKFQDEAQLDDEIQSTQRGFDVDYHVQNIDGRDELAEDLLEILNRERRARQ